MSYSNSNNKYSAPPPPYGNYVNQPKNFPSSVQVPDGLPPSHPSSHRMTFNPNAPPFRPSYMNVAPYASAPTPVFDGFCTQNNFDYRPFTPQPVPIFAPPFMEARNNDSIDPSEFFFEQMFDAGDGFSGGQQFALSPELCEKMMYNANATLLQEVQVGLEQLICKPNEFETWSSAIRERLLSNSITTDTLKVVAEMVLQMVSLTPSIQYNFARLCAFLSKEIEDFRQKCLLPEMRDYHEKQRMLMNAQQQQNVLLFFAEVYEKLETPSGARLEVLGQAVYDQLRSMLDTNDVTESGNRINDSSIKAVVQVLKLTGRHLETMKDGISNVDVLLTKLNVYAAAHRGISDSVKQQIKALTTLRENFWGMREQEPPKPAQSNSSILPSTSSSAFIIGPDGQPLSEEERAFLEENFGKLDNGPSDDNDISDEYEEFLSNVETEDAIKNAEATLKQLDLNNCAFEEKEKNEKNAAPSKSK